MIIFFGRAQSSAQITNETPERCTPPESGEALPLEERRAKPESRRQAKNGAYLSRIMSCIREW